LKHMDRGKKKKIECQYHVALYVWTLCHLCACVLACARVCVSLMHVCTYKISRFGRWGKASTGSDVSMLLPKFLSKRERVKVIWCLSAKFNPLKTKRICFI
jgi:hypothetical protein